MATKRGLAVCVESEEEYDDPDAMSKARMFFVEYRAPERVADVLVKSITANRSSVIPCVYAFFNRPQPTVEGAIEYLVEALQEHYGVEVMAAKLFAMGGVRGSTELKGRKDERD